MGLKLATLTLRREGEFVWLVEGAHHCGPESALVNVRADDPNPAMTARKGITAGWVHAKGIPIRYTLTVACGPTLDHRGFLFDQAMVQLWFERQGATPTALSCEALVIKTANLLQEKIAKDAPHCDVRGVTLQFSPAPFQASVSAHYTKAE